MTNQPAPEYLKTFTILMLLELEKKDAEIARLKHELMVSKASEGLNSQYARAFELERDELRARLTEAEEKLQKAQTLRTVMNKFEQPSIQTPFQSP